MTCSVQCRTLATTTLGRKRPSSKMCTMPGLTVEPNPGGAGVGEAFVPMRRLSERLSLRVPTREVCAELHG